jgi:DNA-binding CsgD family transcriptional regulator
VTAPRWAFRDVTRDRPGPGLAAGPWPLLGRARELAEIEAVLTASGGGGVVLVGAAGAGKTRLAREVLKRVRTGRDVDWVAASSAARSIPFGAVSHLLAEDERLGADGFALRRAADAIARRAGRQPVVLGVDDAHLLDDGSAALVHQLAVRGLVFVVATVRVGEPAPDAIVALWKDGLCRRLNVRPLSGDVVDRLVGHVLGAQVDGVTRQEIRRVAAGNPLYLRELLAGGLEEGGLVRREGVWCWDHGRRYGSSLVDLVKSQLAGLDDATRAVLEVLACGEPLPVAVLDRLVGTGALGASAIDAAERGGLIIRERSGRRQAMRLAHPVHAEVLRVVLPEGRARRLWGWLAASVDGQPLRRPDDALLVAAWKLAAGAPQCPASLLAAARRAVARSDLALAERLVRAASDAGAGSRADRALALILVWQGRHREAAALSDEPPGDADDDVRKSWAAVSAWNRYLALGEASEATDELRKAATDGRARRAGTGATVNAWLLLFDGRCLDAVDVLSKAAAMPGTGTTWPFPLAAAACAHALTGRTGTALALIGQGLALPAPEGEAVWDRVVLGWVRCLTLLLAGRAREASAVADEGYAAAVARGVADQMVVGWASHRGRTALAEGRVATAQAALREAVALLAGHDPNQFTRYILSALAGVTALSGDTATAEDWMRRSDARRANGNVRLEPWVELNRAWVTAARGELTRAAGQARHAADLSRATQQYAVEAVALYDVARLGEPRHVIARLTELAATIDGAIGPVLAAAAAALAARDGLGLDAAAAAFHDLGFLLHAAEAASAAARSYREAGLPARACAAQERALALARACEGARTPLLSINDKTSALSAREREIALLAASGLSSKTIASCLNLSVRTVSNHLAHAYAKLGITRRTELATVIAPPPANG